MKMLESFVWCHQNSRKSLFQRRKSSLADDESAASLRPIPQLSLLANSVVIRCAKVLKVSPEDLQHRFDIELTEVVQQVFTYSRNLLEFCSCQALNQLTARSDYISDPEFRRLTYDMMLAWESPSIDSAPQNNESPFPSNQEGDEEEGGSLFYSSSTNMAVQVDFIPSLGSHIIFQKSITASCCCD